MFSEDERRWLAIFSGLNEVQRRQFAAQRALELQWGGVSHICKLTGMSHHTIDKGIEDLKSEKKLPHGQLRKKGGGRKKIIDQNPSIRKEIDRMLNETTAGSPMRPLKWINKSTYTLAQHFKEKGNLSKDTIRRFLKQEGYSLQSNRKNKEGKSHPERNAQFEYINQVAQQFLNKKQPIISVDTKKKEIVGNFKNNGRTWRKKGSPLEVNVHDFPNLRKGKAAPYGAYDLALNKGFVNVGITSDTAEFAVESIRQWWKQLGKKHYSHAKELLITADAGGSNSSRNRGWKYFLAKFAKQNNLAITVLHYPPGTSKWNKIEHKLFCFISQNWKGKPLITYQIIINFIKNTTTKTGLKVYARLDTKKYAKGLKFTDEQMNKILIKRHATHPNWNYTIKPK